MKRMIMSGTSTSVQNLKTSRFDHVFLLSRTACENAYKVTRLVIGWAVALTC